VAYSSLNTKFSTSSLPYYEKIQNIRKRSSKVIWKEYGTKGKDRLSATEREFKRFLKTKPTGEVISFIKGSNMEDSKREKETQAFVEVIKSSFIYKRFNTIESLQIQVLNSLISFLEDKGELSGVPFDKAITRDADYKSIDEKEVKDFLQNRAIKLKVSIPKISVKDFLVNTLKVARKEDGKVFPTNTAMLFFGKDPYKYISQPEIKIARFKGATRVETIDSKELRGSIYKLLDQVLIFFKRNTRLAGKIVEFKRVDIPEYPYEAIREALINAIAHRDYTRGGPIIISIFDDRVEVSNPGGLLPGLDIKKLEGHHNTRNETICSIFHETRDMERFGTGISKMKLLMKKHGLSNPVFSEEGDFFVVKFYGPGDKILDLAPDIPEERQIDLKKIGFNERQIEILRLMVNKNKNFDISEYYKKFKINEKTARRDLKKLVELEFVEKVGSTKKAFFRAKL